MSRNWWLGYIPRKGKGWYIGNIYFNDAERMSCWNARVLMSVLKDEVAFIEKWNGKKIYPSKFNNLITDIGVYFGL